MSRSRTLATLRYDMKLVMPVTPHGLKQEAFKKYTEIGRRLWPTYLKKWIWIMTTTCCLYCRDINNELAHATPSNFTSYCTIRLFSLLEFKHGLYCPLDFLLWLPPPQPQKNYFKFIFNNHFKIKGGLVVDN